MPIAFQNATTATVNGAATGTINVPAGTVNGDMLVLGVCVAESVGVDPTVTGFTQKATADGGGTEDNTVVLFWRRASSEPASYTVTLDASFGDYAAIAMLRYTGVISSGDPFRTSGSVFRSTRGTPQTSVALTGVQASDLALHMAGVVMGTWNTQSFDLAGPGGSWVERGEVYMTTNSTAKPAVIFVEQLGTGSAPTLTATGTASASNIIWCFAAGALMEEPAAVAAPPLVHSTAVRRASTW
ncbi:hypothetical protein [Streptomyces sp. NPDC046925]|uniref:hypothetical protein n=1 Tax=Streptomyces sp. NPDC046925 TaxID=3155375 RepID=UPI0033FA68E6